VSVKVAQEGILPAGEGEEGDRGGNSDVHADHAGLDLVAVAAHRRAGLREDRGAVAEAAPVDDVDRLVERVDVHDRQHRAEDLLANHL
jgi:hypothetical protein